MQRQMRGKQAIAERLLALKGRLRQRRMVAKGIAILQRDGCHISRSTTTNLLNQPRDFFLIKVWGVSV
jgi:hypothetical protein